MSIRSVKRVHSAGIGAIRRIQNFVLVTTLETANKGLVQPYFEYCSPLWDTWGKLLKDKLQRFNHVLLEYSQVPSYDIRSADLIDSLSRQTIDDRRRCAKLILMYKILNDHTIPGLRNSFVWRNVDQTDNYLRNTATDLTLPKPKKEFLKRSFKFSGTSRGAMLWKPLPNEAKLAESISSD